MIGVCSLLKLITDFITKLAKRKGKIGKERE
jgi:hypothetical protein